MQIPIEWQYLNIAIKNTKEKPPYIFEPYENPIGRFQLSCHPLSDAPLEFKKITQEELSSKKWRHSIDCSEKNETHIFICARDDQALTAKYIYNINLRNDSRILDQLKITHSVLDSIVIVPLQERTIAANLDKYDRFLASLVASYDLLYSAINSNSYIELIIVCANQIDAFLRLGIVIKKQLQSCSNDIEIKYLFQDENEKGILERSVFNHALELGLINQTLHNELSQLYNLRNRVVHRYIISPINTRDMVEVSTKYLEHLEKVRILLRELEEQQIGKSFGIYGNGFVRAKSFDNVEIRRAHSWANDKHLLKRFNRKITSEKK